MTKDSKSVVVRVVRRSTLRLRPGVGRAYESLHARLPEHVNARLIAAGVLEWQIWRTGRQLIHVIDLASDYDELERRLAAQGEPDPEWDRLVDVLVRARPSRRDRLRFVWRTTQHAQQAREVAVGESIVIRT